MFKSEIKQNISFSKSYVKKQTFRTQNEEKIFLSLQAEEEIKKDKICLQKNEKQVLYV